MPDNIRDQAVSELVADGIRELTRLVWRAVTGDDKGKDTEARIAERVLDGLWKLVGSEVKSEAERFELVMAVHDVAGRVGDVLDAFVPKGSIPPLGLDIEEVPGDVELTLSDGTKLVIPETPSQPATKRKGKRR